MQHSKSLISIIFILLFSETLSAQWHNINLPPGNSLNFSYVDRQGNIFMGGSNGLNYSDDKGKTWTIISNYSTDFIETAGGELFVDGGNSIDKFNRATRKVESYYYANKLFTIDNQGYLWSFYEKGYFIKKSPSDIFGEIVIIGKDTENCGSWVRVASYLDDYKIIYDGCGGNELFRSENNSVTSLNQPGYTSDVFINQGTGTLFLVSDLKLYRSIDKGDSFDYISSAGEFQTQFTKFVTYDNGRILIKPQMIYSDDDGITWKKIKDNYINGAKPERFLGSFLNNSDSVIVIDGPCKKESIYQSTNKGANWESIHTNLNLPQIDKLVEDISGKLYTVTCSDSTVQYSIDQGNTWNNFWLNYNSESLAVNDLAINSSGHIFAVSHGNIYKSIDNGQSFNILTTPNGILSYGNKLKIIAIRDKYLYISNSLYTLVSSDNGDSWKTININYDETEKALIGLNGNLYYYALNTGFSKYDLLSDKFNLLTNSWILDFEITANGDLYYITDSDVFITKNDLQDVKKIKDFDSIIYNKVFSDKNNNVYFCFNSGIIGEGQIYVTSDEGNNFNTYNKFPDLTIDWEFYVSNFDNLYIIGSTIYKLETKLSANSVIKGKIFDDNNSNCGLDQNEIPKKYVQLIATGSSEFRTFSDSTGAYRLTLPEGNYSVDIKAPNLLWDICPPDNVTTVSGKNDIILNKGLSVKVPCPYLTLQIQTPVMRRCFENTIYVSYCNEGTVKETNVTLTVNLADKMTFVSSTLSPTTKNGNELTFTFPEILPDGCGSFQIIANLDCSANIDEVICNKAKISPVAQCTKDLPRLFEINKCSITTGSFDPNDKTGYIDGLQIDGKTEMNEQLEYLIRFQNTGTDTAFRVVIEDKIPDGFDINTLILENGSHPFTVQVEDNKTIRFIFDPIMLPDSNVNEKASHGFVAFRISPLKDLPYGTELNNFADIFFDFNSPVRTNTAFLTVTKSTSTSNIFDFLEFSYFPNPMKEELNIKMNGSINQKYQIGIKDLLGRSVLNQSFEGSEYILKPQTKLKTGIYFIDIQNEIGQHGIGKFIVH